MRTGRLAAIAGATTLALTLAACSGSPTPTTTGGSSDEPVTPVDMTLTLWSGSEAVHAAFTELADEFREDNPELGKFTVQVIPFAEYVAQVSIQLQGGDAPDLGWIVDSTFNAWVDSGALYDMSVLKSDPAFEFDDIAPGLYSELGGKTGEFFGYPFANTTHPVIYNKTAFEAAGVETPLELFERGEWNWDNLRRLAKEVVDAGVVEYGFDIRQFNFTSYALFMPVQKGFGGEAWPGSNTCGMDSPANIEATQFLHDMIFVDKSAAGPGSVPNFGSGDTAMLINPPSLLAQLGDVDFEIELVPQPQPNSSSVTFNPFLGQAALSVFKAGKNPELATKLAGHFASPKSAVRLLEFYLTPRASILNAEAAAAAIPGLTPEAAQRSLIDTLAYAKQQPFPVNYPEVEATIKPILDGAWVAGADVAAVLQSGCAAVQSLLN